MADWGGFLNKGSRFGGQTMGNEDFDEESVWAVVKEGGDPISSPRRRLFGDSSGSSSAWHLPAAPRMILRAKAANHEAAEVVQRSSSPLDIPDWSKIYGKNAKKESRYGVGIGGGYGDDDDDDDGDDDVVPPHEWIAKKLARSQISSFSVCEGIGRTLKGRDLSKVRNAVLTKTGFIE